MKCCICGGEIFKDINSNNPWPLCHKEDMESRCCPTCNDDIVLKARLYSVGKTYNDVDNLSPWNSVIAILWASKSDEPVNMMAKQGKILAGQVQEIDRKKNTMKGAWGNFEVSLTDDNWFIIDLN